MYHFDRFSLSLYYTRLYIQCLNRLEMNVPEKELVVEGTDYVIVPMLSKMYIRKNDKLIELIEIQTLEELLKIARVLNENIYKEFALKFLKLKNLLLSLFSQVKAERTSGFLVLGSDFEVQYAVKYLIPERCQFISTENENVELSKVDNLLSVINMYYECTRRRNSVV